jgi:PAS domain S-box-containing protein
VNSEGWVASTLILLGAGAMLLSILRTRRILALLKHSKYLRSWQVLAFLMVLFLAGYLGAVFLLYAAITRLLLLLTGAVFFSGALFVLLVVHTGYLTIDNLEAEVDERIAISENLQCEAAKRQRADEELQKHREQLEELVRARTAELQAANRRLKGRNADLAIVNRVSQALAFQLDLDALIELVGEQMRQTFEADIVYVALYDRHTCTLHFPYQFGDEIPSRPLSHGLTERVIETGQPLLINEDVSGRRAELDFQIIGRIALSYLGVPIPVGRETIGVISVQSTREEGRFDEDDVRLLSTIAASVGTAIQNAQLYREAQRRASEMATLAELGREIAGTLDLSAVLERIAAHARELLDADNSAVYLLQPDGRTLKPIAAAGDIAGAVMAFEVQLGQGILGSVVQSRAAERVNDVTADPRTIRVTGTDKAQKEPALSLSKGPALRPVVSSSNHLSKGEKLMVAPLLAQERAMGAMVVWRDPQHDPFGQADLDFLVGISQQAAVAIGNARLFAGVESQVTELRRAEEAIQESERRLADIISFLPDATLVIDGERKVIAWNRAIEEMTGVEAEEMLGKGDYEYAIPFYGERRPILIDLVLLPNEEFERKYAHIERRGPFLAGETYVPHVRGRARYLFATASVLRDSKGNAVGAIETIRDITERKEAERQIQLLGQIAQQMKDAVILTDSDPESRIRYVNDAFTTLYGYTQDEVLGQPSWILFAGDDAERDRVFKETTEAIARQGQYRVEYQDRRKDSSPFWVSTTMSAVRLGEEGELYDLAIVRDITDRKQAEHELQQAKATAEAATQAKSAFLAMMSHEIRTPMNAVIGMTSLLLDTDLTSEQREFAETIRTSGDALLTIINDILDFSKIEAGRIELERQPFDLRDCIESGLALVAPKAAEKGLELGLLVDDQAPAAIFGDEARLRQILLNLLSNAVKFTEEGEVVVSLTSAQKPGYVAPLTEKPGLYELHFAVRDTGIGIPPDRVDRLFKSFSQVDSSTTRKYGGTGLGLVISKRLSEMMGGTMWVESPSPSPPQAGGTEGGPGSTFHFNIQARVAPSPVRAYLQPIQLDLKGKRVLIVDDNATNRRILTLQTKGWGMVPRATGSPEEALEWIRRGDPFDVAMLDQQMPEMDGLMLAAQIQRERGANGLSNTPLPLVAVSSLGPREVNAEGGEFAAFLLKPIRASQLYNTLVYILATEERPAQREQVADKPQFDSEMGQRLPLRILLAEDNAVNQKLALRLLERLGYRADVAANGLEAIEALQRQPYDVVLMDVQMPDMDGLEATQAIHQEWPGERRPRIVAMTANVMKEDREACLEVGMDDYLGKPIRVEELIAALSRCQALGSAQK